MKADRPTLPTGSIPDCEDGRAGPSVVGWVLRAVGVIHGVTAAAAAAAPTNRADLGDATAGDRAADEDQALVQDSRKEIMVRAVRVHAPGGIEDLRVDDIEPPEPGEGEALVRVHAAAITRDELDWAGGRLPAIPSYELSGVLQKDAEGMPAGQEVFALTPFDRDGVASDYAAVPVEVLAAKPRSLNHTHAAVLPMPGLTAWQALMIHGDLQPGWRVAITGMRGGVGHLAAQLVNSKDAVLVDPGQHCDLLFDTVGGDALAQAAQHAGRIVTIAAEAPGAHYFVVEPNRDQLDEVARLADAGSLVPQIDSTYPLHKAQAAFTRTTARGKHGKVVIDVNAKSRLVDDE